MPVYGNAIGTDAIQLSRDLPPEKRIELYEFEFENDENEVPAKKFKKRKPRGKLKEVKFFENIGKNVPPPSKPKKVVKKCAEEVPKRVLPKRGALRPIVPSENTQFNSLSSKNGSLCSSSLLKSEEPPSLLSTSASANSFSSSKMSSMSTCSSVERNPSKQSLNSGLFSPKDIGTSFNRGAFTPSGDSGNLLHQISFNDLNESAISNKSSTKTSPVTHNFKIPSSVTVRNLRSRQKTNVVSRCSSPKASSIRCSSPNSKKRPLCSSPNISESPNRTLLFGATSPIAKQNSSSVSLFSTGSGAFSLGNQIGSVESLDSLAKSFDDDTCLIAGKEDDSYVSVGEEGICHYFGFEEEEEEKGEENIHPKSAENRKNVPKKMNNKKMKVQKVKHGTPEKPPIDEVLLLLKSSVPVDSVPLECEPEPFSLDSHIWSPLKTQPCEEMENAVEKPADSKKCRPRTKLALEKVTKTNQTDKEEGAGAIPGKKLRKENVRHAEEKSAEIIDADNSESDKLETDAKLTTADSEKDENLDGPFKRRGRMSNIVYKVPKRPKEANKPIKEKKETEGNKKEMDEFEALAASLNAQFHEIDNFDLAVE